jgi:hypothetical protein
MQYLTTTQITTNTEIWYEAWYAASYRNIITKFIAVVAKHSAKESQNLMWGMTLR